jgi:hypothetical protein
MPVDKAPKGQDAPELLRGICDFAVGFNVTIYTSGTELRGPAVHFGTYETEQDAKQALADAGFTNGQWGWRYGYTDAVISQGVNYTNFRADLLTAAQARAEQAEADVARLQEALAPSGDTKAAYIGEVKDPDTKRYVSWTAIKMIMAMIAARAALREGDTAQKGGE